MSHAERESAAKEEQGSNQKRTRCEVWTRVMGYHRPVSHFNGGKKSEHYSRKHFEECVADNHRFREQYPVANAA